jgi:hypothetical protein
MFSYLAYGLKIRASFPLPELPIGNGAPPDVTIARGKIDRPPPQTAADGSYFSMSGGEAYLYWDEVGGFLVREGREIIVDPLTMTEEHIIRLPLLGTVLSAAICQRGFPGFHGSAVEINGQAIAFLGHRGSGKSTMAAGLYARGHNLLTDDLVVVKDLDQPTGPTIVPSFPQLKLFPEAARASLGDDPESLPRLISGFDKRARRITDGFAQDPVPLRALYLLENDSSISIEPVPPQETLVHVVRHSYAARIFNKWLTGPRAAAHFRQCADLVRQVPIYVLKRPRALDQLPQVAELLEAQHRGW